MPTLVNTICEDLGIRDTSKILTLRAALNQKDGATISSLGGDAANIFSVLLSAVGPVDKSLEIMNKIKLSTQAKAELDHLKLVVKDLKKKAPDIKLTVDPVEIRGYEYHTILTFTFFSREVRGELGRGGRYIAWDNSNSGPGEMATGVTLFIDTLLNSISKTRTNKKLFVPTQ